MRVFIEISKFQRLGHPGGDESASWFGFQSMSESTSTYIAVPCVPRFLGIVAS